MTPEIVRHQSSVDRHRVTVWDWEEDIISFIVKFLDNPDTDHVYDCGTEWEPQICGSPRKFRSAIAECKELFERRPEVRNNIRLILGCHGPESHSHEIRLRSDPHIRNVMSTIPTSYMPNYLWYRDFINHIDLSDHNISHKPKRLLSCLMHWPRPHKIVALNALINTNLINTGRCHEHSDDIWFTNRQRPSYVSFANSDLAWHRLLDLLKMNKIPKGFDDILSHARRFFPDRVITASEKVREVVGNYYHECLFDIVVEATHTSNFFTEKTFKPLFHGKPFVIMGKTGINTRLSEWGFESFPEYFDLSQEDDSDLKNLSLEWGYPQGWQSYLSHYERILQPLTQISDIDLDRAIQSICSVVREKCIHNQDRLVEIMFDDDLIPSECWDTRTQIKANDYVVNPLNIGKVRSKIRSHPYFGKFVKVPKTFSEEYFNYHQGVA